MNSAQRSFAAGEVAPSLYARTNQDKYATGLRTCRNLMVMRHGGVTNRPGTKFTAETKASGAVRLVRFAMNATVTCLLEFGDNYLRFHQNGAPVLDGSNPYEIATPFASSQLAGLYFVQNANQITIVHPDLLTHILTRNDTLDWVIEEETIEAPITAPQNVVMDPAGGDGSFKMWIVTAVAEDGSESIASTPVGVASVSLPQERTIKWDAVTGAVSYNVYEAWNGVSSDSDYGFIGSTGTLAFYTAGIRPDFVNRAPLVRDPFAGDFNSPSVVGYYQSRRLFANSIAKPETVWGSRVGNPADFRISAPLQDDDAVTFALKGRRANPVRHILDLGKLILLTDAGEWVIEGDAAGILRPGEVNPRQYSHNGASKIPPVVISDTALYVQARGTILRDLANDVQAQGFKGSDLTVFSAHLFDGHTIVDMDYQQIPHSIVWVVRNDGVLLGLTYIKEQQIWGWHRHDSGTGLFENVCVVPEGADDAVYFVVNRSGARYIERLSSRFFTDIADAYFVDCGATVSGDGSGDSPALAHLTGLEVSILGDGFVLANPNNPALTVRTITSTGTINPPLAHTYTKLQVGLPYTSDFETLDVDTSDGPSLKEKKMLVNKVGLFVEKTRGLFVGMRSPALDANDVIDGLDDAVLRDGHPLYREESPEDPILLVTDVLTVTIQRAWDNNGRIFARNIDPLPVTILSAIPQGMIPRAT